MNQIQHLLRRKPLAETAYCPQCDEEQNVRREFASRGETDVVVYECDECGGEFEDYEEYEPGSEDY